MISRSVLNLFVSLLSVMLGASTVTGAHSEDIGIVADWIKSLQYTDASELSFGAIKIHHTPGHIDSGIAYFRVLPYNSSLAVVGLLRSPVAGKLEVAERWMTWYLSHLNLTVPTTDPQFGVVYDHWYLVDGTGETTCPPGIPASLCVHDDASDSYAAVFLLVASTYLEEGGNASFLNAPDNKEKFEIVANVILGLQQLDDGLTWAKDSFPHKLLMDNCEVYRGLKSMELLEQVVFSDTTAAATYAGAANLVRNGIESELFEISTGLYRIAEFENEAVQNADVNTWFLGTAHLVWPHLFGVIEASSARAQAQMAAVNTWDGVPGDPKPDWTTNIVDATEFLWPSVGFAALLAGDSNRARAHANFVLAEKFSTPLPPFPFTADDAGWLLRTLSALATTVSIDIKPGSDPNSINLRSNGVLPVAIFSTNDFDVLFLDEETILFGDPELVGGEAPVAIPASPIRSVIEDVDGDGLDDLLLFFSVLELDLLGSLDELSDLAVLIGETFDGVSIEGLDSVHIVPPKGRGKSGK